MVPKTAANLGFFLGFFNFQAKLFFFWARPLRFVRFGSQNCAAGRAIRGFSRPCGAARLWRPLLSLAQRGACQKIRDASKTRVPTPIK